MRRWSRSTVELHEGELNCDVPPQSCAKGRGRRLITFHLSLQIKQLRAAEAVRQSAFRKTQSAAKEVFFFLLAD